MGLSWLLGNQLKVCGIEGSNVKIQVPLTWISPDPQAHAHLSIKCGISFRGFFFFLVPFGETVVEDGAGVRPSVPGLRAPGRTSSNSLWSLN